MSRLALRHPFVTVVVLLVLGTSVGIAFGWVRNDVEWHLDYSSRLAKHAKAQSILSAVFPPKTPEARFQAEPAPDFTLTDQDGKLVSLRALGGKVVLINFMLTECKDMCSQTTRELREVQRQLARRMGRNVLFLSITVDPRHDTPAVLKAYADKNRIDPRSWRFLTGTEKQLAKVRQEFDVRTEAILDGKGQPDIAHTASTFVVDPDGWIRAKLQPGSLVLFGQVVVERVLAMSHG